MGMDIEEGLSLFDGEMDCLTSISKDARASFVMVRLAHQRFRIAIRCKFNPEWTWYAWVRVFKLGECHYGIGESISKQFSTIDTAISIMYGKLHSGVEELYKVLSETALGHGESVYCKNGCFVVENEDAEYRLRFVLEGRGKSPQEIGWMEDGVIKTEMVHRMGIYQTRRLIAKDGIGEEEYVRSRLYFDERFHTRGDWRNPADRFVDSYKISQRLKKQKLDIIYGRHPNRSHNEFVFCRCDEDGLGWDAWKTSSFFTMSEGQAVPLLAIFESVIPYYYEYYYDKFHFRKEEAEQILDRIKTVRLQIINDPCDPSLGKISQRLLNSHFAWEYPDDRKAVRFDEEERCEILSQNRFRVLALLDFFAWWLSEQRNSTSTFFDGFYVEGP